ncbi:MAG: beta-lactamase family protein [Ferruginibacter sp.]|nr:beta-lactamase family protein [Chitinophagaceae bacterium]
MKNILITTVLLLAAHFSPAQPVSKSQESCDPGVPINPAYSRARTLDSILKKYTTNSLPGVAVALYSEKEGWWAGTGGYAHLEKKIPMDNCHLQYLQSISKTYLAVAILKLKEQGKIDLDAPVTQYLPKRYSRYINNAAAITVRMLLNHTSGVPEYNSHPVFVSQVLLHPLSYFTADDCLKAIAGEEMQFAPGSRYTYTNTNYLLLALIGDAITGDHAAYIKKNIFKPLGLTNSYYGNGHDYLKGLYLPSSYWDALNTGRPADVTGLQVSTVVSSKGDDGIVCTTTDAVKFLKGLMEGKLLTPGSMKEMLDFVKDEKGRNRYGMGMIYFDLGGIIAYGHGGGGIGAGCGLLYIPSHQLYVFFSVNLGVLVDGELAKKAEEMKEAILKTVLE